MSAYDTKKRGADFGVQITFPSVFQALEFFHRTPQRFFQSGVGGVRDATLPEGNDHYARFHEIKQRDAHQSVLNGIQANKSAQRMMLSSHQNYFGMPKPVLSQRKFANPSLGAGGIGGDLYPARRDVVGAQFNCVQAPKLKGGVLFTQEGRQYAKKVLADRVKSLDRIKSLAEGLDTEGVDDTVPIASRRDMSEFGDSSKVEFNLLRQNVIDAIESNKVDKIVLGDISKMMALLFRYAVSADASDFEDIIVGFENIEENLLALLDSNDEAGMSDTLPLLKTALTVFQKAREYAEEMFKNLNRPTEERQTLSKSLVKSLGFARVLRKAGAPIVPIKPTELPPELELPSEPAPPSASASASASAPPPEEEEEAPASAPASAELGVSDDGLLIRLSNGRVVANDFEGYSLPRKGTRGIMDLYRAIPEEIKLRILRGVYPESRITNPDRVQRALRNIASVGRP